MYLSLTRKYEIHTRASKIEPKYEIFNGPQGTTRKLYKKKSRGKRSRMVLYRCRVAQSGGNWLKMAKTVAQKAKMMSKIGHICILLHLV